eukprot:10712666-Lingulodinium_polyedra.AAC.1
MTNGRRGSCRIRKQAAAQVPAISKSRQGWPLANFPGLCLGTRGIATHKGEAWLVHRRVFAQDQ